MIDRRHKKQMGTLFISIAQSCDRFNGAQRLILGAAVWAMADEFPDLLFEEIGVPDPSLLDFFCDCVKHHWAVNKLLEATPCSITSEAIRCPFSDDMILRLVRRFEKKIRLIWVPKKKARVA
jgi:hypothetical protein